MTIIEEDIERYTAYLENEKLGMMRCKVSEEAAYDLRVYRTAQVLTALEALARAYERYPVEPIEG